VTATTWHFAALADTLRSVTVEITDDGASLGCGVLWPSGCVVTNAHVVRRPRVAVLDTDGRRLDAQLVARDRHADLAVFRLATADLPTATLAEATAARVGALVVAVGHPLGVRGALTAGIVHAIAPITRGGPPWIHADLRLAPGNSGGPLADVSGAVVGINAMVVGGLALAVPVSRLREFVRDAGLAPA
jgi:serine protease Do